MENRKKHTHMSDLSALRCPLGTSETEKSGKSAKKKTKLVPFPAINTSN